jgi:DNA-binding LacI/PurR family transcriptional regulator
MPYPIEDFNAISRAYIAWVKEKELYDHYKYYIGVSRRNPELIDDRRLLGFHEEVGNLLEIQEDFYGKGRLAAHIFMEKNLDATAILGFNDDFSLGLIKGFQELGVRVPEDISVLGFDGINNRKYVTPMLTTMGLFPEKQGAKCVEVLLDIIEGKKYKHINHTGFKLLEGGSVRMIKEGH